MITSVRIRNFRSFVDAEVSLQPFSLVVGSNGAGKSNLLRFFEAISAPASKDSRKKEWILSYDDGFRWECHLNSQGSPRGFSIRCGESGLYAGGQDVLDEVPREGHLRLEVKETTYAKRRTIRVNQPAPWRDRKVCVYSLNPAAISEIEQVTPKARIGPDGSGTAQVLDILKNGDREDLFDQIEEKLRGYVPEVEKLSLLTVKEGFKQIQIRERGLERPTPGPELSEGTRLILAILTILHQESPPPIILLEDVDRGMHPRLFGSVVPLMKEIATREGVNIIATTHNPYLVDAFQHDWKAVVLVEKIDGASTLTSLEDRIATLDYNEEDATDLPLGQLWFSGLVGAVPRRSPRVAEVGL